jgi:phenylalanyl-tRNA synthetase beta chain
MKFTLSWLKQHLDTDASVEAIAERLTMLGLEIEEVADRAAELAAFTVGYVVSCERHPNADRLTVCLVDTGARQVQVVCGAPNAHTGMKGVFAPAGVRIPGTGLDLKKTVIRGVESNGMLCSEKEMGLSEEHAGIIELPDDAPLGAPFAAVTGLADPVIEIAVTPNRGDCLGVHGVARDLAAAGLGRLKPFNRAPVPGTFDSPIVWKRDFAAGEGHACPMVVGRYFRDVTNRPSPRWLQDRLRAIGLRPISALVDITNLVTMDLARPLHVFDADRLAGDLSMRFARPGETILALDGRGYDLEPDMVVIADDRAVHGIGGVMGGEHSGCTEATRNVFLEVALFDPLSVAGTGRRLGIESDARYRFERGVDPTSALWGAEVAARLVGELCGGEASELVIAGAMPAWERDLALRWERIMGLGGGPVANQRTAEILEALGFQARAQDAEKIVVAVPPWRPDVAGEADLVEEVVRVHGYDRIPAVPLPRMTDLPVPALDPLQRRVGLAKRTLAARGLAEAVTWSFMSSALAGQFGGGRPALRLANPIAADLDEMRPSPLPNLLAAAKRGADRGLADAALFEVGPAYRDDTPAGQGEVAAGVRIGRTGPRHWLEASRNREARPVDAFDAKADALAVLAACGVPLASLRVVAEPPPWYHPGRAAVIRLGPKTVLAAFGELHPRILKMLDLKGPAVGFEVRLDAIPAARGRPAKARPVFKPSPLQPVERDFAFVVDDAVAADRLLRAVAAADKALITAASVFDVYAGEGIAPGRKSIAVTVTLQPFDRTLTEPEIDAVARKIVANVAKETGGVLRA